MPSHPNLPPCTDVGHQVGSARTASQVVAELQALIAVHGDLQVKVYDWEINQSDGEFEVRLSTDGAPYIRDEMPLFIRIG